MSKGEEMKGRAKEAAGAATDDEDLKREGKVDQASAAAKEKAGEAVDKIRDTVDKAADKAKDALGD